MSRNLKNKATKLAVLAAVLFVLHFTLPSVFVFVIACAVAVIIVKVVFKSRKRVGF